MNASNTDFRPASGPAHGDAGSDRLQRFGIAAPAAATTDNSGYVGVEGGILFPKSQSVSGEVVFTGPDAVGFTRTNLGSYRYKKGYDVDVIGGYDFGMFRVEGELGYKHAKPKGFNPGETIITTINTGAGTEFTTTENYGLNSSASVFSAMANAVSSALPSSQQ